MYSQAKEANRISKSILPWKTQVHHQRPNFEYIFKDLVIKYMWTPQGLKILCRQTYISEIKQFLVNSQGAIIEECKENMWQFFEKKSLGFRRQIWKFVEGYTWYEVMMQI